MHATKPDAIPAGIPDACIADACLPLLLRGQNGPKPTAVAADCRWWMLQENVGELSGGHEYGSKSDHLWTADFSPFTKVPFEVPIDYPCPNSQGA